MPPDILSENAVPQDDTTAGLLQRQEERQRMELDAFMANSVYAPAAPEGTHQVEVILRAPQPVTPGIAQKWADRSLPKVFAAPGPRETTARGEARMGTIPPILERQQALTAQPGTQPGETALSAEPGTAETQARSAAAPLRPVDLSDTRPRTLEGRVILQETTGDFVTEQTITINDPRINNGRWTNIPTIFDGQKVSDATAADRIVAAGGSDPDTGRSLPGFDSRTLAEEAAQRRSEGLARELAGGRPVAPSPPLISPAAAYIQRLPGRIGQGFLGGLADFLAAPEATGVIGAHAPLGEALRSARTTLRSVSNGMATGDPDILERALKIAGSLLPFFGAGIAATRATQLGMQALGMAAQGAGLAGAAADAVTQAGAMAGGIYDQLVPLIGEEEASQRANTVLGKAAVLFGLAGRLGPYAEIGQGAVRLLGAAIAGGVQGILQHNIQMGQFWVPGDSPQGEILLKNGWIRQGDRIMAPDTVANVVESALLMAVLSGSKAALTQPLLAPRPAGTVGEMLGTGARELAAIAPTPGLTVERQQAQAPGPGEPSMLPEPVRQYSILPQPLAGEGRTPILERAVWREDMAILHFDPSRPVTETQVREMLHGVSPEMSVSITRALNGAQSVHVDFFNEHGNITRVPEAAFYEKLGLSSGPYFEGNVLGLNPEAPGTPGAGTTGIETLVTPRPPRLLAPPTLMDALQEGPATSQRGGILFRILGNERGAIGPEPLPEPRSAVPLSPPPATSRWGNAESPTDDIIRQQFAAVMKGSTLPTTGFQDNINYDRIKTPEDVKGLLATLREAARVEIAQHRRGTMSRKEIEAKAREHIMSGDFTLEKLLFRPPGTAYNAEDIMAARLVVTSMATDFQARLTDLDPANPATWEPHFQAFQVFKTALGQLMGVEAESGRGQNAFIPDATGELHYLRQLGQAVDTLPTGVTLSEWKTHLQGLKDPVKLAALVTKSPTYWDMLLEAVYGLRLMNPPTHVKNTLGNVFTFGWTGLEGELAAFNGNTAHGELMAQVYGARMGLMDLYRTWAEAEQGQRLAAVKAEALALAPGTVASKIEGMAPLHPPAITAQNLRQAGRIGQGIAAVGRVTEQFGIGNAVDLIGSLLRSPTAALEWEDLLGKVVNYQGSLYGQAYREAVLSQQLRGKAAWDFVQDYVQRLPDEVHAIARQTTLENTLQEKLTGFSAIGEEMLNFHPAIRLAILFYRTPINAARWALRRTPLGMLGEQYQTMMAEGGAQADLAKARIAFGSTVMLAASFLALEGLITGRGPVEPERRREMEQAGWKPYAAYNPLTKTYIGYDWADPVSMVFGMGADFTEILKDPNTWKDRNLAEQVGLIPFAAYASIRNNILSRTWATGARDLINLVNPPPYMEADQIQGAWEKYAAKQTTTLIVPGPMASVARIVDPVQREAISFLDKLAERIPWLSSTLPVARNLFAHPRRDFDSLGPDFFSPIQQSNATRGSQVEVEMARLAYQRGVQFPGVPTLLTVGTKHMDLTAQERELYARLIAGAPATGELPRGFVGPLEQVLGEAIRAHQGAFLAPNEQSDMVLAQTLRTIILRAKDMAQKQMSTMPRFQAEFLAQRTTRLQALGQALGQGTPTPGGESPAVIPGLHIGQ